MKKKHPIRRIILLLLAVALVAGLAMLPMLTAGSGEEENKASILSGTVQTRQLVQKVSTGAPLTSRDATAVEVPSNVIVTEFLVNTGDLVHPGDAVARVDDVSVMYAVKTLQETMDATAKQIQSTRAQITAGPITVNENNKLCVNDTEIPESKLSLYTQFLTLSEEHRKNGELLLELFRLHQTGTVTASCEGLVGDVDKTKIKQLSASGTYGLMMLAWNTPDGDDDTSYTCFPLLITEIDEETGFWTVKWGQNPSIVEDFLDTSEVDTTFARTEEEWGGAEECVFAPVHNEEEGEEPDVTWEFYEPQVGDILLYAIDHNGNYWVLYIGHQEPETQPSRNPSGMSFDISSLMGGGSGRGGFGGNQEQAVSVTERVQLCTITPADTMNLFLSVDELDVSILRVGMQAEITLEALPNRQFSAEITEISQFGTNNGGSSKFQVTLELPRSEGLLPGMNTNVSIPLQTTTCLTIPVAALVDQGNKSVVYTARDEKTDELTNPVPVQLGISDGEYVQILSGLTEGQTFWYRYYDTLEISTAVERSGLF